MSLRGRWSHSHSPVCSLSQEDWPLPDSPCLWPFPVEWEAPALLPFDPIASQRAALKPAFTWHGILTFLSTLFSRISPLKYAFPGTLKYFMLIVIEVRFQVLSLIFFFQEAVLDLPSLSTDSFQHPQLTLWISGSLFIWIKALAVENYLCQMQMPWTEVCFLWIWTICMLSGI